MSSPAGNVWVELRIGDRVRLMTWEEFQDLHQRVSAVLANFRIVTGKQIPEFLKIEIPDVENLFPECLKIDDLGVSVSPAGQENPGLLKTPR
ncbi:MAG TPA: hypothetical protein VKP61_15140 [Candidatus Acidoferrum sp.]|nr:hypothetical protein [Candidatus Acidoferrum sp.]